MDPFIKAKVKKTCEVLKEYEKEKVFEVTEMQMKACEYKKPQEIPAVDDTWEVFRRHDRVHGRDRHFWFYTEVDTPADEAGKELILELNTGHEGDWDATNPQGLIYLNGEIVCGLDVNHHEVPVKGGQHYEVLIYFYMGMIESYVDVFLDVNRVIPSVRKLYYDIKVPLDAANCYPEKDYTHIKILKQLELACNRIDFRKPGSKGFYDSIAETDAFLKENFYGKVCGNSDAVVSYIGHTHIDVAWLWTYAQTREKVQRTFSTVLMLMDRYPEYKFMSSQPQLFKFLKEEEPALYEKVREKVKEGRFEVEGAMWVEADCNLSSGESLVRQVIHGKKFMQDEFNVESKVLWLPDVFGYSAALPQILRKTGVDTFVTSKISWNETDTLPYDTFYWQGIDGTEVFSYFLTAQDYTPDHPVNMTTYNSDTTAVMNKGTWERYQQKEYNNEVISTFGYGDGGGGPTLEMIEREKRLEAGLPGQPKAQISRAGDFLKRAKANFDASCEELGRTPKWVGELYLEKHRGTYTSIAKNKRNNRKSEFLIEETETFAEIARLLKKAEYPAQLFYDNWETILLNQFHDVIPGSSIFEVYEDSDAMYKKLREEIGEARAKAFDTLAGSGDGYIVFNPNGFTVSDYVSLPDGQKVYAKDIPALGYKVLDLSEKQNVFTVTEKKIVSPFYEIEFNEKMQITRLYDKENRREVIPEGSVGNVLRVFENYPYDYDNWEICNYYEQKYYDIEDVVKAEPFTEGDTAGLRITWKYLDSTVTQEIRLYGENRRIDFKTDADWHEVHMLLKTLFPVNVRTEEGTYEIQYGHVKRPGHRNTSWDQARFEVCAHKWMDVSEEGYGVSLLNDCKYGHSLHENVMTLSLIKTGTDPNKFADIGAHTFTYALLPHEGSFKEAGTVKQAYVLNRPLSVTAGSADTKCFSLASSDSENIVIETAKKAENGEGTILRLFDAWNKRGDVTVKFGVPAKEIWRCDLLENPIEKIGEGAEVTLPVGGFEIVTLLLK